MLVKIGYAGICGSDLAIFKGSRDAGYPLIMGHEAIGRIVDVGTPVVIEPNIPCCSCGVCRAGHGNVCPNKRSLGMNSPGVFAEYVAVPAEFAHALPAEISPEDAVGIEPLAVALHAVQTARVSEGQEVAVIGCGAEGLLLVQVLVASGAHVTAADIREDRLEVARQLGAKRGILVDEDSAEGLCAPVVFEVAGARSALELALRSVAPAGRVIALGLGTAPVQLQPFDFVRRGISLIGSLIYDHPADFHDAIQLVYEQRIRPSRLIAATVEGIQAMPSTLAALLEDNRSGKTIVRIGAGT
jgi:threonine dehydrogenase-like Zn-dependent dehydrogenase